MIDQKPKKRSNPQTMFSILAVAFVVFMILFIYTGPLKKFRRSQGEVDDLRARVSQLEQARGAELARLRSQEQLMARIKERKPNFDLWSFMNTMLTEMKLKDRATLENFKPRADRRGVSEEVAMVQLRLAGFVLGEFVDLLHKIYASNNLIVMYRLEYLRPTSDNKGLECNITFLTPKA